MAMSDGNPTGYRELMQTEVIEFYYLYKAHIDRIERLNAAGRKK